MRERGLDPQAIAALRCPLGNSGGDKRPQAIAIATAAELLTLAGAAEPPTLRGLDRHALARLNTATTAFNHAQQEST
ncbi:hypothetical protein [Kushneria sinocarnis]|uniref:hypothetical protein n=1 Tax=Kushneria sinocarnis TaxID=595502 RepID=UPI0024830DC4|nr:hypothetical protein [Kushneria sinocarnis]